MHRTLLFAALSGALVAGACSFVPPVHLLTHEFTQIFAAVAAASWFLVLPARLEGRSLDDLLAISLGGALALGVGALGVRLVVDGPVRGCLTHDGAWFFLLTWIPLALLAAFGVVAAVEGGWGWRKRALLVVGLAGLAGVHDLVQAALSVRITDPFIGPPLFESQRALLRPDATQVLQRAWLAAVGPTVWAGFSWFRDGRQLASVVVLGGLVAFTGLAAGPMGLGCGTAPVRRELRATLVRDHLTLHYSPEGPVAGRAEVFADEGAWHLHRLRTALDLPNDVHVDIWLYDDEEQLLRLKGLPYPHASLRRIDLGWKDALDDTFPHELMHALHVSLRPHPGILMHRGFKEGVATAFGSGYAFDASAHTSLAAALSQGELPSVQTVMSPSGFRDVDEGAAYNVAGAFLGWLFLTEGAERFVALNQSLDFEGTYGVDLAALEARYHTFLGELPLSASDHSTARRRFDSSTHRPYHEKKCPKLGVREPAAPRRAELLAGADPKAGAAAFGRLAEKGQAEKYRLRQAQLLLEAGEPAEALAVLDQVDPESPDRIVAKGFWQLRASLLVGADPQPALDTLCTEDAELCAALTGLLADEALATVIPDLLGDRDLRERRVRELRLLHPDNAHVRYLVALWGGLSLPGRATRFEPDRQVTLDEILALLAEDPGPCTHLAPEVLDGVVALVREGNATLATATLDRLDATCPDVHRAERKALHERLAWRR